MDHTELVSNFQSLKLPRDFKPVTFGSLCLGSGRVCKALVVQCNSEVSVTVSDEASGVGHMLIFTSLPCLGVLLAFCSTSQITGKIPRKKGIGSRLLAWSTITLTAGSLLKQQFWATHIPSWVHFLLSGLHFWYQYKTGSCLCPPTTPFFLLGP